MQLNCYFRSGSCTTGLINRWDGITDSTKTRSRSAIDNFLLAMRMTAMIMLVATLSVSAKGVSQNVTFSGKNVSLEKVFDEVKKQTGLKILYTEDVFTVAKPISVEAVNLPVDDFVALVLKNQAVKFIIENRTIFISKKAPPVADLSPRLPSPLPEAPPIKGVIRDADGKPVAGVNVVVKGTKKGVAANADGSFNIDAKEGDVLVISSVGFTPRELKVGADNTNNIVLQVSNSPLDEVQIIAYGTQSQRYSTGNVTTVKGEDIQKQPVSNPLIALQGRVPGLQITQSTGLPGSGISVQIQGKNSLTAGLDPFYVVDGVPFTAYVLPNLGSILGNNNQNNYAATGAGNPLDYINPSDIESISVLKDADATAIYGSRAANGAILITTKKGKAGRVSATIGLQEGVGQVPSVIKLMNTQEYLQMRHEALKNNNNTAVGPGDYDLNGVWDSTRNTDWQKVLIGNTAQYSNLTGSISGGSTNTQYLAGVTYHRETSVFPGSFSDQKASAHFNINSSSPNQKFKLQVTASYLFDNNKLPKTDLSTVPYALAANAPELYNPDGSLNWAPSATSISTFFNPIATYTYTTYQNKTNNLISNAVLGYQILPGLEIKSSFGYTNLQQNEVIAIPRTSYKPSQTTAVRSANFSYNNINSWIAEPQATYKRAIGKGQLNILLGSTFQRSNTDGLLLSALGYPNDQLLNSLSGASTVTVSSNTKTTYNYCALFTRLNYISQSKYILELSARRDGSSRFGEKNQLHNFASIGGGWIFSEEEFIKTKLPFLSFGKLKASYGTTGNDQIGDYKFMNLYSSFSPGIPYQGLGSLTPSLLDNPYLQWEETKKINFGMDLAFLKEMVVLNVNYFLTKSSNQLLGFDLPLQTGFSFITKNFPATIQNSGLEVTLHADIIQRKAFTWSTNIFLTIPIDNLKLIAFDNLANTSYASTFKIGNSMSTIGAYHFAGVNSTTGVYQFSDGKSGMTSRPDTNYIGTATTLLNTSSKYYGGVQNSIQYKNLDFGFFFQFQKQLLANGYFGPGAPGGMNLNQPAFLVDHWQKSGDNAQYQKFNPYDNDVNQAYFNATKSDRAYSNLLLIRLQNVSFGWGVPQSWCTKAHFQNAKLSFLGQNIFSNREDSQYLNPWAASNALPPLRTLTIKLQVTL